MTRWLSIHLTISLIVKPLEPIHHGLLTVRKETNELSELLRQY